MYSIQCYKHLFIALICVRHYSEHWGTEINNTSQLSKAQVHSLIAGNIWYKKKKIHPAFLPLKYFLKRCCNLLTFFFFTPPLSLSLIPGILPFKYFFRESALQGRMKCSWDVPSSAPGSLSVKIPALPPSEESWDN